MCEDFVIIIEWIDLIVESVVWVGVLGVWMIGGGFGGVVIVLVFVDRVCDVVDMV